MDLSSFSYVTSARLIAVDKVLLKCTEWRLWVKCGTAECGMRKVKCGMESAERR